MTLGNQIKQCRTARGFSQPELAEMAGIEQSYLSKLENDKSAPSNDVFRSLLSALSMSSSEFLRGIDTQKYRQQLNQIADIEALLSNRDNLKIRSLRRFLYAACALLILGITFFYTGFSKQVFSENQYQYQSLGVVQSGEPLDIYSSWSRTLDATVENSHSIREQKRVEIAKRRDDHYLLTTDNRSQRFNIDVDGGKRMYSLDKEVSVPRAINAWLQLLGVLFFAAGIVGFGLERRLYKLQ
ncbi:helix-turn-helix transcriptional regulator [Shewanella sp. KX20019]|uniref:helix-turn-helix domain-containing protein n=1 Tax=Shewanella sp. KX20019 TaxID=2803864 RepID=UPI001928F3B0|nr:helix-turn-helix transcriptional regulator [Shewanella sp. KX20019]QQX80193.1 helix-turn-helix transcriptional regulator [Shewanella sp. KX20019]